MKLIGTFRDYKNTPNNAKKKVGWERNEWSYFVIHWSTELKIVAGSGNRTFNACKDMNVLLLEYSRMRNDCSVVAKDTVTFIVFLSDSKTTKIFSNVSDLTEVFRVLLWLVWLFKLVPTPLRKHRYLARSKCLAISYSTWSDKPKSSLFHASFTFKIKVPV
jgi:hypothetical protein